MVYNLKKYSKKIMCMLSAGMFFVMAVFYPLESFRADVVRDDSGKSTVTFENYSYTYSNVAFTSNHSIPLSPDDVHSDILGESNEYTYFYLLTPARRVLTTTSQYYAYKLVLNNNSGIPNRTNIYSLNSYFSTDGNWYNLKGLVGEPYYSGQNGVYWYVTDFSDGQSLYFGHLILMYEYTYSDENFGAFNTIYPSVSYSGSITVTYVPYTIDDLTDEIYSTLQNVYSTNQQMLSKLGQIYNSIDTVETKLQSLIDIAEDIESNTDELEGLLKTCNSYLASIDSELKESNTWLEKIYNALIEYFGLQGDDSVEEMPDQEMDNMLNIESELLGDASASDLQNDLNVSIDADCGSFVWNLIDRLITSNLVVFGGFISVLSLGIVALILGR